MTAFRSSQRCLSPKHLRTGDAHGGWRLPIWLAAWGVGLGLGVLAPSSALGDGPTWCCMWYWEPGLPNPDCNVYDDPEPCWGPCCPDTAGPGVFVDFGTGNVWTEVPVARVSTDDGAGLDFHLRYD